MSSFPQRSYGHAGLYFADYHEELQRAWKSVNIATLKRAAGILLQAYSEGSRVFTCGNGGSASIANHFTCDHAKGTRDDTGLLPRVTSLSVNTELITAIANDVGYDYIFSYQLTSQATPDDVLIAISSSGRSQNIASALSWARSYGMPTIALTGFTGGDAARLAELSIHVDCDNYGVVEDVHQSIAHSLAQFIRQSNFGDVDISEAIF
jgi:D-sedoheptulose 7-phosphate isomerase/D-glycero-D-manno-heptose 1,7-bisphosphate phosphatase